MTLSARFLVVFVAIAIALPCVMCEPPCFDKAFTTDFIYAQGRLGMMGTYAIDYDNRGWSMNATGIVCCWHAARTHLYTRGRGLEAVPLAVL